MRSDGVTDVERPWMEFVDDRGIVAVRDELVARGVGAARAAAIAVWLADQVDGRKVVYPRTGTDYRAVLREVGSPQSHFPG